MRTIKFRAWDTKYNQMVLWDDISKTNIIGSLINNNNRNISHGILMQFTGLLDKNSIEIYEGDILARVFDDYDKPCIVSYEEGILSAHPIGGNYYRPLNTEKCKTSCHWCNVDNGSSEYDFRIIGNIYENPELLGKADVHDA